LIIETRRATELARFAVILAGGSGTRFWPASRRERPKQFLAVAGQKSLLRATFERLDGMFPPERVIVAATSDLAEAVRAELPELPRENILGEPMGRNTAACIAWASFEIERRCAHSLQLVLPADHVISPRERFQASVRAALSLAGSEDVLVTFGIRPTYPATGFGYIETAAECGRSEGISVHSVSRFVEKPDAERAARFLAQGNFLWNSGMFAWSTAVIRREIAKHMPEAARALARLEAGAALAEVYQEIPSAAVDVAILERADNVRVLPLDYSWNDVGSWSALAHVLEADSSENLCAGGGEMLGEDARGCIAYAPAGNLVALIGVSDLVVVHAGNATLVCPRGRDQEVRAIVARLAQRGGGFL
jgi:mannose-1-phosphate guanylyltransferase